MSMFYKGTDRYRANRFGAWRHKSDWYSDRQRLSYDTRGRNFRRLANVDATAGRDDSWQRHGFCRRTSKDRCGGSINEVRRHNKTEDSRAKINYVPIASIERQQNNATERTRRRKRTLSDSASTDRTVNVRHGTGTSARELHTSRERPITDHKVHEQRYKSPREWKRSMSSESSQKGNRRSSDMQRRVQRECHSSNVSRNNDGANTNKSRRFSNYFDNTPLSRSSKFYSRQPRSNSSFRPYKSAMETLLLSHNTNRSRFQRLEYKVSASENTFSAAANRRFRFSSRFHDNARGRILRRRSSSPFSAERSFRPTNRHSLPPPMKLMRNSASSLRQVERTASACSRASQLGLCRSRIWRSLSSCTAPCAYETEASEKSVSVIRHQKETNPFSTSNQRTMKKDKFKGAFHQQSKERNKSTDKPVIYLGEKDVHKLAESLQVMETVVTQMKKIIMPVHFKQNADQHKQGLDARQ